MRACQLQSSHLRHADYALVPVIEIPPTPKDQWIDILEISSVADFSTLCISADVIPTNGGSFNAGAVMIQVSFYQLSGISSIPSYDNTVLVGGRSLCTGLSDQRTFYVASSLDVRLPIIAPFVGIQAYFPTNQVDQNGINFGAWCTNDPSYQYGNPFPVGFLTDPISAADSILGSNNSGFNNTARGILVPATTVRVVELASQTIGLGHFHFRVQEVSGAAVTPAEVATWVCTKSGTDTTGNSMDQVIYAFGNTIEAQVTGIPLVGFRESVCMFNASAGGAARSFVWYWSVYPEFS